MSPPMSHRLATSLAAVLFSSVVLVIGSGVGYAGKPCTGAGLLRESATKPKVGKHLLCHYLQTMSLAGAPGVGSLHWGLQATSLSVWRYQAEFLLLLRCLES